MDHGEMAAWLLEQWNLKSAMIGAVQYHHLLDSAPDEHHADAVLIAWADSVAHLHHRGELSEDTLVHPTLSLETVGLKRVVDVLTSASIRANAILT